MARITAQVSGEEAKLIRQYAKTYDDCNCGFNSQNPWKHWCSLFRRGIRQISETTPSWGHILWPQDFQFSSGKLKHKSGRESIAVPRDRLIQYFPLQSSVSSGSSMTESSSEKDRWKFRCKKFRFQQSLFHHLGKIEWNSGKRKGSQLMKSQNPRRTQQVVETPWR